MTKLSKRLIPALLLQIFLSSWVLGAVAPQVTTLNPVTEGVSTPVRLAIDPVGNFYVTDPRGGGVLKHSSAGNLLRIMPTGTPPQGIALTQNGNLVVSEGDYAVLMDGNGVELRKLGNGAGQFKMANGIAVDAAGYIYVVDSLDNCVQVFTAAGDYSFRFGSTGNQPGQFSMPSGIAYEKTANQLAVADTLNGRVQFFDVTGAYQKSIGSYGSGPLKFTYLAGIAFEYDNGSLLKRMYAVDAFQSNVQAIDPSGSGAFLSFIGSYGSNPGQLMVPNDVAFDQTKGRLIVTNGYGNLSLFGIDWGTTPTDTIPPALTLNTPPVATGSASLTVSGTVEEGASVTVSVNGAPAIPATVTGTDWSILVSLAAGMNTISVRATDAAGNFTILGGETTLADLPITVTIDPFDSLSNVATRTISGSMAQGATVSLTTSTRAVAGAVTYPTATTWKSVISGLAEGDNVITATARKTSGSITTDSATITLDTTAPALVVSALADGSHSASRMQNITGRVTDLHLDKVTVNGTVVPVSNGLFSAAVELVNGVGSIAVKASDLAGNVTADTRAVSFDAKGPSLAISSPADGISTKTAVLSLKGTVAANCTVTVNGAPAAVSGTGWNATVNLASGVNTLLVSATDLAGNVVSLKRTVLLDVARPELAIGVPAQDTATNTASLAMTGTATAGSTVAYAVNGVSTPLSLAGDAYGFTVQFANEGVYAVTVTATDAAGNSSVTTRNVIYDKTLPALLINPVTTPAPVALSGSVDPHATVTAADKNGAVGNVVASGGTWNLDLTGIGYDPATIVLTATDAAGNSITRSLTGSGPDGDLDGDGRLSVSDALRALRIAVKLIEPTADDYIHGDVGPLVGGSVHPNGTIDLVDAILILRKVVGLESW